MTLMGENSAMFWDVSTYCDSSHILSHSRETDTIKKRFEENLVQIYV